MDSARSLAKCIMLYAPMLPTSSYYARGQLIGYYYDAIMLGI